MYFFSAGENCGVCLYKALVPALSAQATHTVISELQHVVYGLLFCRLASKDMLMASHLIISNLQVLIFKTPYLSSALAGMGLCLVDVAKHRKR